MKTIYKTTCARLMTLLVLALLSVSNVWGGEETYTFSSFTQAQEVTFNATNFTITLSKKTGSSNPAWSNNEARVYAKGSLTIESTKNITKVVYSYTINKNSKGKEPTISSVAGSATAGTWDATQKTWTGSDKKIVFATAGDAGNIGFTKVVVTYEDATPTTAYTVTFSEGTKGTCSTASLTEASAGSGVTLPSCTANTGYVFKGWSTSENGTTPDAGVAGETYNPTSNCTLYAVYNALYTLNITQPDAGILTVTDGTKTLHKGDDVEVGTNLTCEVTGIPEGKRFSRFYAKYGESNAERIYKATNPATFDNIPTDISALEVYVTYQDIAKYTINYMVNGVNTDAQENVFEGTELVFPTVGELGGKVFVGWSESEVAETDEKPTLVETTGLTASKNINYYAVFATFEKGDGVTKTDVLNRDFTGVTDESTSYTNWTKSSTSGATYSGNSAGSHNSIQLRTSNSNSGIVSTVTGGIVKKISVEWESNTSSGRTLNVYGCNSAYTNPTDLYSEEQSGTLIGTIVCGTSTELSISDEYAYIGLRSNASAMYLSSISIEWLQGTPDRYSAYCTTVTPLTQDVAITSAGYATAYVPFAATVEGATAYYVTVEDNKANLHEIEGTIPANTGVVLKGAAGIATFTESAVALVSVEGNLLVGTTKEGGDTFGPDGKTYYILSTGANGVGFYWDPASTAGEKANCAQYKAVLAVPASAGIKSFFSLDDETTSIHNSQFIIHNSENVMYNLNGQVVGKDYKGIVIVNGKKMLNK